METFNLVLTFYKTKKYDPLENSRVIFLTYFGLVTGTYIDGKFYHNGQIYFPDFWAYIYDEQLKQVEEALE